MAIQQETYSTNKLTVTQMENGKGLIRSRNPVLGVTRYVILLLLW